MSINSAPVQRGPGRPRDEVRRARILDTAADLAAQDPRLVTMERIASQAHVSRTTLYKWWTAAHELLIDALQERTHWSLDHAEGTAIARLTAQLDDLVRIMTDPSTEGALRAVASGAATDPEIRRRFHEHWLAPRREVAGQIITAGIGTGELRSDLDVEAAIDAVFSPVYERAFYTGAPLDDGFVGSVMRIVAPGLVAAT
ncbi:TetR/AcrR family transcriptional regulator [Demequina sp. SYSU T00039]|uniref:TetR/AcrR family transcriptional regulator n=1 Tax=Demequina lignilytica TaxID=3051663 RepID=A0AAW7M2L7_9MICO|nr:TetR/AcrR family transcriptional regulator [Demequina sp. SYSU T00039]MDN4486608.1 TetR/AcrR family transcriptional regulator [Demequina sp. SYSU T00039]